MSKFVGYSACPRCTDNGKDSRGDNLANYDDGGSHCFACGYHRHGRSSSIQTVKTEAKHETSIPADFQREVPRVAWQWLLQYGLGWKYWQPFVGWSEKDSRLIFTFGNPIHSSIGRYIGDLPDRQRKWYVWGNPKTQPEFVGDMESSRIVVLTEDIISAHKVAQVTLATPLLGTSVHERLVPILRHLGLPIVMWLDKDQENLAVKRANALSIVTGLPVRFVFTDKDPKELSSDRIKKTLDID